MTGNTMWRTSSYSGGSGGDCVEVRDDTGRVLVRDTKDRTGPVLPFTPQAWQRFADRVKHSLAGPQAKHPRAPLRLQGAHPACTGLFLVPSCSATPCAFFTVMCGGFAAPPSRSFAVRTVVPGRQEWVGKPGTGPWFSRPEIPGSPGALLDWSSPPGRPVEP